MERAKAGEGAPAAAELDVLAYDVLNIVAANDFLDVFLGDHTCVGHLLFCFIFLLAIAGCRHLAAAGKSRPLKTKS